ncbi:MAG: ParB domain protein nuclease [Nevskia sp.]|nr:ParB domain protein nuclease [Nevskia sp.]
MDMRATTTGQELLIPLTALRPSRRNVRKSGGTPIRQLARSIERVQLLHNLVVTDSGDGKHYDVEAGKRRLKALQLLAKRKRLPKNHAVRCLLVPDEAALTASLTENTQREDMHPADEFEAFQKLAEQGQPIEDIAADFGVTPLTVQRRMRLANVSPRLLADYRKDQVTLEQLMALAVTDDHRAQEAAFYDVPEWQRRAEALRGHLTAQDVDAARDPVARFVGLEAYEAAGGGFARDLFADEGHGIYLHDRALLDKLAVDKLAGTATDVELEGWAWIEVVPRTTLSELYVFQRVQAKRRKPTVREGRQIAKLEKRIGQINAVLQAEDGEIDEPEANTLQEEAERFSAELAGITQSLTVYAQKAKAIAGAVVTVDSQGKAVVHRGLVREADAKQIQADTGKAKAVEKNGEKEQAKPQGSVSEKLARQLSAHRTAGLQAELSRNPTVALVAVVHRLVLRLFYDQRHAETPLQLDCTVQDRLDRFAPDLAGTPVVVVLAEAKQAWRDRLPAVAGELFAALRELSQDDLLSLLAVCAADCLDAITPHEADTQASELAAALDLDMTQWWTATAAGYFAHVSKARIIEAIKSFAPKEAHQLEVMKKGELAGTAERLAAGTGWLPEMLRKAA